MLQDIDLRELAEVRGNGRDVVSAYFSGREGLSQLKSREKQLSDLLSDDELEAENFQRSMQTIRELLEQNSVVDATGVCFFCSNILDFAQGYPVSMPVPNKLIVGPAPYIRPLAELQDEYETFAMIVCDNDRTRIFAVTNKAAEVESAIRGGIKNHVRKGGWSQQRYERRRDEQLSRYGDEISAAIENLVRESNIRRIVLLGSEETMRIVEDSLSDQVADLIVARDPFDLDRTEDDMLEHAYESYFNDERRSEKELWQRIKGEFLRDGRAVAGPDETLEAAKIGRVEDAVVTRDIQMKATACRSCENVSAGKHKSCDQCKSKEVFEVDFVDALVRHLKLTAASLDFVDELPGLSRNGHVAAMLRY